jgi:sugar/nucleoside kinase (ribokinase family)
LNWDPCWGISPAEEIKSRKQAVRDVLPWVDIAHGNVRELTEFADAPNLDKALARLTDWGARSVLVHLGTKGAGLFQQGSLIVEPPAPVQNHLNSTGTGDVLSVCYMLLHNQTATGIEERLRLANSIVSEFIEGRLNLIPALAD